MSFVTVPQYLWPRVPTNQTGAPSIVSSSLYNINGVGEYVAWVFSMPETATISKCFWAIASATTGCTCLARVETVDTATGLPTGTLAHANASQSVVIASGAANYEITFPGTFSLSQGTIYALVIAQSSGTPVAIQPASFSDDNSQTGLPYVVDFDASAAARFTAALCVGLGKSGGGGVPLIHAWPISGVGMDFYQATDTPDTIGNSITTSAPMRVAGVWAWIDADSTGTIKLYAADGSTVLGSAAIDTNIPPSNSAYLNYCYFTTSIELPAGTYYLAAEATGGANIGLAYCDFTSADWLGASPMGGDAVVYATCTQTPANTASWTTTSTRQAFIGMIIDGIESGGGGGGGETSHVFAS